MPDADNRHIRRSDHEVDVICAAVSALGVELVLGELLAVLHSVGIVLAECQMAGRVFVEERIVEENLLVRRESARPRQDSLSPHQFRAGVSGSRVPSQRRSQQPCRP